MANQRSIPVLTYHARNIAGYDYSNNDHVALAQDLATIRALGMQVIRATQLVAALREGSFASLPPKSLVITFDDGPLHDVDDVIDPQYGPQKSMLNILKAQDRRLWGLLRRAPSVSATTFVIASEQARTQISLSSLGHADGYTDRWWHHEQQAGYLDIGSHSWNHVHPAATEMADHPTLVEAFHKLNTREQADLQIVQAAQAVRQVTQHDAARLFAYPYGYPSEYLVHEYLPQQTEVWAAFTTIAGHVTQDCNVWMIPRFVCGHHWKSTEQFRDLLRASV
jgi:peptidoglycan/xylan/chitin deacetylase (PgdA/CDA1 family)